MIVAYIFDDPIRHKFKSSADMATMMMKFSLDSSLEDYMTKFAERARVIKQDIRTNTVDNFIEDCHKYGYIKIVERNKCA